MKALYPEITPYRSEMLPVSNLHTIYLEEAGNPEGRPVVFLHGGPGGGIREDYRRYFNPQKWRIILFDQRGCGNSLPFAELKENTTWDLVADMEKIRTHLGIEKWAIFGGSWGSTLALSYAITHPEQVECLFLRGIFLLRAKELRWFYQEGASKIFPDLWEEYVKPIPESERGDLIAAFYKRLTDPDSQVRAEAARAWSVWEGSTSKLIYDPEAASGFGEEKFAAAFARIECHYFVNNGFFESSNYLLENIDRVRHIPAIIVQGRYDVVCPAESAWELHRAWPEAQFHMIPDAGHSLAEAGITNCLVEATDRF